jgi:hypothetical protein
MKALSVRAPWWWAILLGKPVENRDWYTNQRGRVYLHASKFWKPEEIADDLGDIEHMAARDGIHMPFPPMDDLKVQCGCLVGSVEIIDCVQSHPSAFFVGRYGFVLRKPVALPQPIRYKGALGFFDVPDNIEESA